MHLFDWFGRFFMAFLKRLGVVRLTDDNNLCSELRLPVQENASRGLQLKGAILQYLRWYMRLYVQGVLLKYLIYFRNACARGASSGL